MKRIILTVTLRAVLRFLILIPVVTCEEGEGFYASLNRFIGDLGKVTQDVSSGVQKLARGIQQVQEFLDSTVEENCVFECPDGSPGKRNPDHVPQSNGCGTFGLEEYLTEDMLPSSEFVSCCDTHDLCYGRCFNDKDECDLKFKKCLYKVCSNKKNSLTPLNYKACQAGAKLLYTGTTALGCQPYINAQREACLCPSDRGKPKKDEF